MRRALFVCSAALIVMATASCSAITGVDKYDVNDCPRGDCSETGASSGDGAPGAGDASLDASANDAASIDAPAADTLACPTGSGPVTLTVTNEGTVSSNPSGLTVSAPNTGSACLPVGTLQLRSNGPKGTWTGASCKDGNSDADRCEFENTAAGATVTASLQN